MGRGLGTVTVRYSPVAWLLASLAALPFAVAEVPRVVSLTPANGAADINPATAELVVTFDRDMKPGSHSVCGGGPLFPKLRGQPVWKDARTLVIKVVLEPEHVYEMSLNCESFRNFKSDPGNEELTPTPWSFTTGSGRSADEQKKLNERSLDELMTALRDSYSYYDRTGTDWPARAKELRSSIVESPSTFIWVERVTELLSAAHDSHMSISFGGRITRTNPATWVVNFNFKGVEKVVGKLTRRNKNAFTAELDGGIFYLLIPTWSNQLKKEIREIDDILKDHKDAKGIIIDVRPNGGGDESLAREVAAWFVEGSHVYSRNAFRDANAQSGFGPMHDRKIKGNRSAKRYTGPVALLVGPNNMSSCESFIMMMKQGKNVTLVGAQTGGSSGYPRPRLLENKVEINIPSWKDILPDGTLLEGNGIKPDVAVNADAKDFETGDPIIERALQTFRKK